MIGFFGPSGGGKTRTALIFARGFVGEKGRIVLIDTEKGRGALFADKIPGGYKRINFEPPFSPERYGLAFDRAAANADIVICDSMSHEWDGRGGVLEMQEEQLDKMAGNDWGKRERVKMASWITPKIEHRKFVQQLLRSPVPVICCLRGHYKTRMIKNNNKTEVITDTVSSPIFDDKFLFEMLVSAEVHANDQGMGGFLNIRKITHEDLWNALPKQGEQVTYEHGRRFAEWCKGAAPHATATAPTPFHTPDPTSKEVKELTVAKKELWKLTDSIHKGDARLLEQFLIDEAIISDTETLAGLALSRMADVIAKVKTKLSTPK